MSGTGVNRPSAAAIMMGMRMRPVAVTRKTTTRMTTQAALASVLRQSSSLSSRTLPPSSVRPFSAFATTTMGGVGGPRNRRQQQKPPSPFQSRKNWITAIPGSPFSQTWNNSKMSVRSLFIQTESTPNPESIKFVPGREVIPADMGGEVGSGFYATRDEKTEIARSPLAKSLFEIDGVKSVYLGSDFVTVTKAATSHWEHIRTLVFSAIMDFYATGKPVLMSAPEITDTTILDTDDEVVAMIKELLESRIRPAVQEDGGDIRYVGFDVDSGLVQVQLAGSCVGCPSSSVTLKNGVENMLMHYIPEVTGVEAIEEEEEGGGGGDVVVENTSSQQQDDEGGGGGEKKKMKTYEERLAAAGIPFSD